METVECVICLEGCQQSDCELKWNSFYLPQKTAACHMGLSAVYNCRCKLVAHNDCLRGVLKCPTCRKQISMVQLDDTLRYNRNETKLDRFIIEICPSYYYDYIASLKEKYEDAVAELYEVLESSRYIDWHFVLIWNAVIVIIVFICLYSKLNCDEQYRKSLKSQESDCYNSYKYSLMLSLAITTFGLTMGFVVMIIAYSIKFIMLRGALALYYAFICAAYWLMRMY
jgi:nitrate/nitrite transporter NarK